MDFLPLLQSIEMSRVKFVEDENDNQSKKDQKGYHSNSIRSLSENDHHFRKVLCQAKLQEIFFLQKLKRVSQLKEEMNKVSILGQQRTDLQMANTLPSADTSAAYFSNFISSYLSQPPFSPDRTAMNHSPKSNGKGLDETAVIMKLDMDPHDLEEEMKQENLDDYQEMLKRFEQVNHLLSDSSDEFDGNKSNEGKRKNKTSQIKRNDEEKEEGSEEESDEKDNSYRSPTTPNIRYPNRYKLHSRKQKQRYQPPLSGDESYLTDSEDELKKNDKKDDKPDNSPLKLSNHYKSPTNQNKSPPLYHNLPLIHEEIIWDLRLPKTLVIGDSKLFFFHNILWRLTFGNNNLIDNYYYFFLSPAEKLKSFISLKVDFLLYGSNHSNIFTASSLSPLTPTIKPTASINLSTMNRVPAVTADSNSQLKKEDEQQQQRMNEEFDESTNSSSKTSIVPPSTQDRRLLKTEQEQELNVHQFFKRKPVYTKRSSGNYTFPVEFSVSRGYEKFISKEDLQSYLNCSKVSNGNGCSFPNPSSPNGNSCNVSLNYYHLKLAVVISTNLGPNGELIGCLNP